RHMNAQTAFVSGCISLLGAIHLAQGSMLLTFDDLSPGTVPNGYGGLLWNNFLVIDGSLRPTTEGYRNGMVSTPNVAFNCSGDPASLRYTGLFDLNSAYLAAAVANGLQVQVQGFTGTNLIYD